MNDGRGFRETRWLRVYWAYVALLLIVLLCVQIGSIRQEAQTVDEAVYLASGVTYWTTGDYRMNPEHPPLEKLVSALPLLPLHLEVRTATPLWAHVIGPGLDEYYYAQDFLYNNRAPWQEILFLGRLPTIVASALFAFTLALWTLRRAGRWASVIALTLFAFDPTLIAHGRYATNDLWVSFFFFLACIAWDAALVRTRSIPYFVVAGLALGCALGTKASALSLPLVFVGLMIVRRSPWKSCLRGMTVSSLIALGVLLVLYRGSLGAFASGVFFQYNQFVAGSGNLYYLFGEKSLVGWWYYYPIAFLIKTPLGTIVLALFTLGILIRAKRIRRELAVLVLPIVVFGAFALFSHVDIGVRYLLPIEAPLFALIGIVGATFTPRIPLVACLLAIAVESLAAFPNYLPFVNIAFGGADRAPRYLLDSNVDWGQDTLKLKSWLDARHIKSICFAYFGAEPKAALGFAYVDVPPNPATTASPITCVIAASAQFLYLHEELAWLRPLKPVAKVGESIYVYDLRTPAK